MTKQQLAQAVKEAGSVELFTQAQIKNFTPIVMDKFNTTEEKAKVLAKMMVMELIADLVN